MLNALENCEPLSQVVFIHDYIQLVFQECTISVYNNSEIIPKGMARIKNGNIGFADNLTKLIDENITEVQFIENKLFSIIFSNDYKFSVLLNIEAVNGPEAFQVAGGPIESIIVEQNG